MTTTPQQDWPLYEARARKSDAAWVRGLEPAQRFALYDELFSAIMAARHGLGDWDRLERWHWKQKVATRLRLIEAFRKLDQLDRERTAANNTG